VNGSAFFALGAGASWLTFEGMEFENVGNGCFQLGAPASGLLFSNIAVDNVQRFIENRIVAGQVDATVNGLTIRDCDVWAFTKGAIRLQYDTHDVLIADVFGDSESIDGDNFAIGIHLTGTVHDVRHERVVMKNCYDTKSNLYWNGDGFTSEIDTYDHTYVDCEGSGCTDAGFDLKAANFKLERCVASDNKRNFRFWQNGVVIDSIGRNPNLRGGTGTQAQVHTASTAVVNLERFTAVDCHPNTIVFDADGSSVLTVASADVTRHPTSRLSTRETNATLNVVDVTDNLCGV
jgi:hypothetical protein